MLNLSLVMDYFTFWISPVAQRNCYLYSQATRSNYLGYLQVLKYLLYLSRKELHRRVCLQTSNRHFREMFAVQRLQAYSSICITPFCLSTVNI